MKEKVNFWETSFFGIFNNPLYSYNSKTKLIDLIVRWNIHY